MKLPRYVDVLKMGKDAVRDALAPIRAARGRKKAELESLKLDERIATKEAEIHELCCQEDVDFERLIDKIDEIELLTRRRDQYEEIIEQMFPDLIKGA